MAQAALAEGVSVMPGPIFYPPGGALAGGDGSGLNALRLGFSNATPERIQEGIRRLARSISTAAAAA